MKISILRSLILMAFISISSHSFAQQTLLAYEKGDQVIKVGFGLGATFSTGKIKTPPIQGIYEYGITEDISIGGILGYASSSENYSSLGKIDYSYLIFGARANYHFETSEKFDPYGGATLGYYNVGFKDHGGYVGDYASSSLIYGVQIGANYYFNNKIGAWAELGYGVGILNLGITFKL